ncbi:MAG: trehalose-6-phosphate synthase [Chloroflexi bacterium]|nr:trehalose-6-phosphate synthase [Chloroflexota bacterium]
MTSSSPRESNVARLVELGHEMLAKRQLILASNRGPVEYQVAEDGHLRARRGSGGVVTALSAVSQHTELTWIASAMGEGDRRAAEGGAIPSPVSGQKVRLRFVVSPRNVYHKFYNIFCNPLLWFLQHYMWNSPHTPNINASVYDAWENGYVAVNQAFAQAVVEEAGQEDRSAFIMLHDYHFYLVAGYIRPKLPNAILQHFIHIPWPDPSYWALLPYPMRLAMWQGLCANDIVGFQAMRDVRNFLHTCQAFLPGAEVDYQRRTVWYKGHLTIANSYPVSIDVTELRRLARSPRVQEYEAKLRPYCGDQTIVRVDRVDPSKNIVRGFKAFDGLLERCPQLRGKVKFLAFLVPSRTHIRQYQRYAEEVLGLVSTLNNKYGGEDWQPIQVFYENNYPQAIAGMRLYDVLLVNAVIDGMNLVAKEGPTVNSRDGILVLSEAVGAHEQLGEYALSVSPGDVEGTTEALYKALTMSREERRQRADALRKFIEAEDITAWLCRQFQDLLTLA